MKLEVEEIVQFLFDDLGNNITSQPDEEVWDQNNTKSIVCLFY